MFRKIKLYRRNQRSSLVIFKQRIMALPSPHAGRNTPPLYIAIHDVVLSAIRVVRNKSRVGKWDVNLRRQTCGLIFEINGYMDLTATQIRATNCVFNRPQNIPHVLPVTLSLHHVSRHEFCFPLYTMPLPMCEMHAYFPWHLPWDCLACGHRKHRGQQVTWG